MPKYKTEWLYDIPNAYHAVTTFQDGSEASSTMNLLDEDRRWLVKVFPVVGLSWTPEFKLNDVELSHFLDRIAKQIALEDVIKSAGYDEDRIAEAILNTFEVNFK